jgi:hypothetical protein
LFLLSASATAAIIGPTVDTSYTGLDSAGERINIDQTNPLVLSAGTYTASQFAFFATATDANTTPFLVVNSDLLTPNPSSDIDSYLIIARGSTISVSPLTAVQFVPFGGGASATFVLAQTTKVYAAVSSGAADGSSSNANGFITSGSVDHHNPGITQCTPTVGGTITSITNPDLARTYGFNITVNAVPEPAALSLLGLAALAGSRRRRGSSAK